MYLPLFCQLLNQLGVVQQPLFIGGILQDIGSGLCFCEPGPEFVQIQVVLLQQSERRFHRSLPLTGPVEPLIFTHISNRH